MGEHADRVRWHAQWRLEKRHGDWTGEQIDAGDAPEPYEIIEREGNLLVYGGASALWQRLIGTGITAFDNANAHLGVGDSTTGAAATQTNLQAATNVLRRPMDATYPQHTDGTGASSNATITFSATFSAGQATFAWNEWGLFNAAAAGRMLNRRVESMGTKPADATWRLAVTLTLA